MAEYTIRAPDGREITVRAPNEAAAIEGVRKWVAENPAPRPGVARDVARSGAAGVAQGGASMAGGVRGDLIDLGKHFAQKYAGDDYKKTLGSALDLLKRLGPGSGLNGTLRGGVTTRPAANSQEMLAALPGSRHTLYEPQTMLGEFARTAGQFAPAALAPGSGLARTAAVALPAASSETAGQLAREFNPDLETEARILGGVVGGAPVAAMAPRPAVSARPVRSASPAPAVAAAEASTPPLPRPAKSAAVPAAADLRVAKAIDTAITRDQGSRVAVRDSLEPGVPPFQAGGENLTALAEIAYQSPGPARQTIREAVRAHQAKAPGEVKGDLAKSLTGRGDYFETLEGWKQNRKDLAEPLKDEAFGSQLDPAKYEAHIEPILPRVPKAAVNFAIEIAKREGRNPEELGLVALATDPPTVQGPAFKPSPIMEEALGVIRKRQSVKTGEGKSLIRYLADRGGVKDLGGELASMDVKQYHLQKPFLRKLIKEDGDSADGAALAAWEEGFFPEFLERPTERQLLDAINEEMRGKPRYAQGPDAGRADLKAAAEGLERRLGEAGIDPAAKDALARLNAWEQEGLSLEAMADGGTASRQPEIVIAQTTRPTLETLHYLKKGMDQSLAQYRNQVTGRLDLEGQPMAAAESRVRSDLGRAMRKASDPYDRYMELWGDESGHIEALELGADVLKTNMRAELLAPRVKKMNDVERANFRKGVGEAILYQVRTTGDVHTMRRLLRNEEIADRVKLAFRDEGEFDAFMQAASKRVAQQDRNNRVLGGSQTSFRDASRADLEAQPAGAADIAETMIEATDPRSLAKKALKAIPRKDRSILGDPDLNARLGRAMSNPDEMQRLLNLLDELERARGERASVAGANAAKAMKSASGAARRLSHYAPIPATGGILGGLSAQ